MKLQIGKAVFEVESFKAACEAWRKTRDENGWGASESPPVTLRDGKTKYHVSYNGRIWKSAKWKPGDVPVYDPFDSVKWSER